WNALYVAPTPNRETIELWDGLLQGGRRLTARGGSDVHHQEGVESTILNVGNPTTHVFARERTARAILDALQAGHVSISYAPAAERLDFTADADGDGRFEPIVGDDVDGFRPGAPYEVEVLKDGEPFLVEQVDEAVLTFSDATPAGRRAYYRVELRGEVPLAPPSFAVLYGDFIAMTNPIYVGFP